MQCVMCYVLCVMLYYISMCWIISYYCIQIQQNMIVLICAILLLAALITLYFIKTNKQILLMTITVVLIIALNFANEIMMENPAKSLTLPLIEGKPSVNTLEVKEDTEGVQDRMKELTQEEKHIVGYLQKKYHAGEDIIVHFQHMHKARLKLAINQLKYKLNQTNTKLYQIYIDYGKMNCNYECFSSSIMGITTDNNNRMIYLYVDNAVKAQQFQQLRQLYLNKNISIILLSIPGQYSIFPLSQLTTIYQFSNNYLQLMLQNHPSKVIQQCTTYRTFDYNLYIASLYEPLIDLCSTRLPTTPATKCIRGYMSDPMQQLPYSLVKHCLMNDYSGIIVRNGFISLQRDYYWAGKVDRDVFNALSPFKGNQTSSDL